MSEPVAVTDEYVYQIAPDGKSTQAAQDLLRKNAFRQLRVSADGTRLEGLCQGSEPQPYAVVVNLKNLDQPQTSCPCGSWKRPCKHALGLLFIASRSPGAFEQAGPSGTRRADRPSAPMQKATVREAPAEKASAPADVGEALLQAVFAEPEDDTPRLIYADWLEDNGRPAEQARAEFIRVQVALARAAEDDPVSKALRARERELWNAHQEEWLQALPPPLRRKSVRFHRGFFEELGLLPAVWIEHAAELFAHHPIHRMRLPRMMTRTRAGGVAVIPHLSRLRELSLEGCRVDEPMRTLKILFDTPFLSGLKRLVLAECGITTQQLGVLVASPLLGRLRVLDLSNNEVGPKGAQQLAFSPQAASLRQLSLANNPIGDAGARALAGSAHLAGLERLDLRQVELGPAAAAALRDRFGERVVLG
jgi:uncharacterized protein (TIGR02996 family)